MAALKTQSMGFEDFSGSKAPGVYLRESFNQPRRKVFSTGVPVFFGTMTQATVSIGPDGASEPQMLSLWPHFSTYVGTPYNGCNLAYAVRGFFENGGHWCYAVVLKDRSDASLAAALRAIGDLNTIDLVCAPDLNASSADDAFTQQQMIVDHCEDMGDRFAILDSRRGDERDNVWQMWSGIDGRNGALYYPWIKVSGFAGGQELVPPCGHVAGVYSQVDRGRGVHKAPANEPLLGVIDLERRLTNVDQDFLNPRGVNCLRSFPGRGIRVWGARTLSGRQQWTYVNVRRLFLTAARWLDWNLIDMTFEPNNRKTWAQIERRLTEYFTEQYKAGALKGASPREAFYVRCDESNNPADQRDSGKVIIDIGLAAAIPFEFVVVRFIRGSRGTHVTSDTVTQTTA